MIFERPGVRGLVHVLLSVAFLVPGAGGGDVRAACAPDSLVLQKVDNVSVWSIYNPNLKNFLVTLTFDDIPDECATYVHPPDTTGWRRIPSDQMSMPSVRGTYLGDIDRTLVFRAQDDGDVGGPGVVNIQFEIREEEEWRALIDVGAAYTPGDWFPVKFRQTFPETTFDLGLEVSFSEGRINRQGRFIIGCEDFEGYHIWRGIEDDGRDMQIIGQLSKEEAFIGRRTGGSFVDSLFYYDVFPTLRDSIPYRSQFALGCLGTRIDLKLKDNQLAWWDCNPYNGFKYYYMVTTFDRGYEVSSGKQGLVRFDRCQPGEGKILPDSCLADLNFLSVDVPAQKDLYKVFAVPNPYRSGGSRLTTSNYQNYPDNLIRFVNVPPQCQIKIYTLSGDLVWEFEHNRSTVGNIEWDTRNRGDNEVTSGIYIWRVEDPSGDHVYGRLVIIR